MKLLPIASTLVFSIASVLGSASAIADNATVLYNDSEQTFYFYDIRFSPNVVTEAHFESFGRIRTSIVGSIYNYTLLTTIPGEVFSDIDPTLIDTRYGIFDFKTSSVDYVVAGNVVERVTLAQIIASGAVFELNNGNIRIEWQSDYQINPVHGGVTFAYLNPVPEPETWAMLLAGLGMVGVTVRKRSCK